MTAAACLRPGDHVGAAFDSADAFTETTIAVAERAIAASARMLIFPGGAGRDDPAGYRRLCDRRSPVVAAAGDQIGLGDSRQVQWAPGRLDPEHLTQAYTAATRQAVADGFTGLWVSVDMTWAAGADPDALIAFEADSSALFTAGELTAVCQYDTRVFARPHVTAAGQAHPAGLANRSPLRHRLTEEGRTMALSGEVDLANTTAFAALLRRLRPGHTLDLTATTFLDLRALAAIARRQTELIDLKVRTTPSQCGLLDLIRDAGGSAPAGGRLQ
ncbi:MEDS domain-containing protein [Actinoplanes sp. NPDC049596]|uniref:MEDS domain-containing protein n=1 Tax=unclassified Actinoplanes TaxID=2626549 RepID=UPI0034372122